MDEQRLADYLAGELDPDEHAAVEAELAGDPALRRGLERMRAADEALASLSTPPPRPGFEDRLHDALADEVARALHGDEKAWPASAGTAPGDAGGDELAARRDRSRSRRATWPLAMGGVAAGLALLAVVGVGLSGLFSGQDGDEVALDAGDAGDAAPQTLDGTAGAGAGAVGAGPVLLASGRDLDDEEVGELLDEAVLVALARRGVRGDEGRRLALDFTARFADDDAMRATARSGLASSAGRSEEDSSVELDAPEALDDADEAEEPGPAAAPDEPAVPDAETRADMRRCLSTLLDGDASLVPAYAEAATYLGEPVIVYGLLATGADDQRYDRLEVWVLERENCQVRTFQQRDH